MNTTTEITLPIWTTPDSYFGFDPVGDYILYARNRDSSILSESNWFSIQKELEDLVKNLPKPETRYKKGYYGEDEELPSAWLYTWTASHWAVGWIEYLMVRKDAPQELLEKADEIYHFLKNQYPIWDENDYDARQDDAIYQWWKECNLKERIEYCRQTNVSIFAARREGEIPPDVYDYLRDVVDCFN